MKALVVVRQMMLSVVLACFCMLSIDRALATPWSNTPAYKVSNAQQAARKVKGKYGGKVLKVQRTKVNGNSGYKVKVLRDNGHVISVKVDARTGKVSGN
ncbi:hypothetical protein tinsulaeT_33670 [Thalassotalea insulae]|uniref:PepSY domain-containing protein n=1 Tax=Thalassotalea insulae TaxID=2056778 RepID=A0ABQ6GZN5_9GAMM|nr:PepSY domain-containing protein [Thalassotalea insulae]GLX80027.1 hypothetical protein tinsulaeT_33670 [Thalassotalea insulae]